MNSPPRNDWVIPTLNDIASFLAANGMHDGAVAVIEATAVVHQSSVSPALFGTPVPLTSATTIEGNIIRFSVYSRNRR